MKVKDHTGFVIALAWPETYCKQAGAWYDVITGWLNIHTNNYYKAGHAALVLIDKKDKKCHYFDFGRYHAPFQFGRVRSAETDHDLEMKTIPQISEDGTEITNFNDILYELQNNPACHGEGKLYASWCKVNFDAAFIKAVNMQEAGPIPYGPFRYKGSNCSRFVNKVILAGKPAWRHGLRLRYLVPLTPTPMNNVNSLQNKTGLPKLLNNIPFYPVFRHGKHFLLSTLPPPRREKPIPENAHWLAGEGAGSWFFVDVKGKTLEVTRYSPEGRIECTGIFENHNRRTVITSQDSFVLTYPANCREITLIVEDEIVRFTRLLEKNRSRKTYSGKKESYELRRA